MTDKVSSGREAQMARAEGKAAPEVDEETGKIINPHNPSFITDAPWYLGQQGSSLKHQKAWNKKEDPSLSGLTGSLLEGGISHWYKRGTKNDIKTKFLEGACANCGATTHTEKDCTERPRAKKAKYTNADLAPDEYVNQAVDGSFESKRDRWNGYAPEDYRSIIESYAAKEEVKQARREQEIAAKRAARRAKKLKKEQRKKEQKELLAQKGGGDRGGPKKRGDQRDESEDSDSDSDSDIDSDEDDFGDKAKGFENDGVGTTVGTKDERQRTTTRNLRIREDTAKYLLNLDLNSAFYDPKSRAMRSNPLEGYAEHEQHQFRGDNFLRATGEAGEVISRQMFALEAKKYGSDQIHDMANPTLTAKLHEEFLEKERDLKTEKQRELLKKYGDGGEHSFNPALVFSQTSQYNEYSRTGRVIHERKKVLQVSIYEEDKFTGDHTSVWGSFYNPETAQWGYRCCRTFDRFNHTCNPLSPLKEPLKEPNNSSGTTLIPPFPTTEGSKMGSSSSTNNSSFKTPAYSSTSVPPAMVVDLAINSAEAVDSLDSSADSSGATGSATSPKKHPPGGLTTIDEGDEDDDESPKKGLMLPPSLPPPKKKSPQTSPIATSNTPSCMSSSAVEINPGANTSPQVGGPNINPEKETALPLSICPKEETLLDSAEAPEKSSQGLKKRTRAEIEKEVEDEMSSSSSSSDDHDEDDDHVSDIDEEELEKLVNQELGITGGGGNESDSDDSLLASDEDEKNSTNLRELLGGSSSSSLNNATNPLVNSGSLKNSSGEKHSLGPKLSKKDQKKAAEKAKENKRKLDRERAINMKRLQGLGIIMGIPVSEAKDELKRKKKEEKKARQQELKEKLKVRKAVQKEAEAALRAEKEMNKKAKKEAKEREKQREREEKKRRKEST